MGGRGLSSSSSSSTYLLPPQQQQQPQKVWFFGYLPYPKEVRFLLVRDLLSGDLALPGGGKKRLAPGDRSIAMTTEKSLLRDLTDCREAAREVQEELGLPAEAVLRQLWDAQAGAVNRRKATLYYWAFRDEVTSIKFRTRILFVDVSDVLLNMYAKTFLFDSNDLVRLTTTTSASEQFEVMGGGGTWETKFQILKRCELMHLQRARSSLRESSSSSSRDSTGIWIDRNARSGSKLNEVSDVISMTSGELLKLAKTSLLSDGGSGSGHHRLWNVQAKYLCDRRDAPDKPTNFEKFIGTLLPAFRSTASISAGWRVSGARL